MAAACSAAVLPATPRGENDENAGCGPASPAASPADLELAAAYEEKYAKATSSIHQKWVVFFEHSLMKQVLKAHQSAEREELAKFTSLFHVRVLAIRMREAAHDVERRRRDELLGLRRRCLGGDGRPAKRPRAAAPPSPLLRAASIADARVFEKIAAFV